MKNNGKTPPKMPKNTTSKSMRRGMVKENRTRGESMVQWSSNSDGYITKKTDKSKEKTDGN